MHRCLLALVTFIAAAGSQGGEPSAGLAPLAASAAPVPDAATPHSSLEAALARQLDANPEWERLIEQRKLAVGVMDLTTAPARVARVNGDEMMYAASLPKIAVLLAAYASFEDGSLVETSAAHKDLKDMIQASSNAAATRMIDAVGIGKIERVMRDPRFAFYDEASGGGLWVGKRYDADGVRRGDPLRNISHGATVMQVARFYHMLAQGRLINEERSAQMLTDLAEPALHHKFVAALERRAPTATVYRKSGSWRDWHADSVLVKDDTWRHYILVAIAESPNGETILRELVPAVEATLQLPLLGPDSAFPRSADYLGSSQYRSGSDSPFSHADNAPVGRDLAHLMPVTRR